MPEIRLPGVGSRPLLGYLKALGLLRVVSLQLDPGVRGRWRHGLFELSSDSDEESLQRFLLDRYAPAPVVSPWNGGSGFHPKDRQEAILALEQMAGDRFAPYRETIARVRGRLAGLGIDDKPEPTQKLPLIRALRRSLPDEALPWLDAAVVVVGREVEYPPLLGSGGNDGRFDFANNYAQAVVGCLGPSDTAASGASLRASLLGESGELQRKLSLAHLSRDSSPTNSPFGEADSLGNPWDLILAVEGTLLLVAGAARRHGASSGGSLVAPFTARPTAAGYGSAVAGEGGRAELWLPIWSAWASNGEIATVARESRAEVGSGPSRRRARTGLDFARAAGELGVARGIAAFERYTILERAGESNLAVPAGRVSVAPRAGAAALRTIDPWLVRALRFAGGDNCPRGPRRAIAFVERAAFALAVRGAKHDAAEVVEALGEAEGTLARSASSVSTVGLRPLFGVSAAPWLEAANDGTPEFAVATAIASLRDRDARLPGIRDYLHGTTGNGRAFDEDRHAAVQAPGPFKLLAAVHARRHVDAGRSQRTDAADGASSGAGQLGFDRGAWCALGPARQFAAGTLDENRVLRLVRGLSLLDFRTVRPRQIGSEGALPEPCFDLLTLAWAPSPPRRDSDRPALGARAGWAARLSAGTLAPVLGDAMLRLQMAGKPSLLRAADVLPGAPSATQLGAALLVRISPRDREALERRLTIQTEVPNQQEIR